MPGDRIAVIAPSSPFEPENLERGLAWLRAQGYEPVLGEHVHDRHRYLAGSDHARAADLQRAIVDPDIAGIICARGGYGAGRLFSHLDLSALRSHCKFLCGFSDVTILHLWLLDTCEWVTFHGPMVGTKHAGEGFDPLTAQSLLDAMRGVPSTIEATDAKTLHPGKARGRLLGGNLCMLTHTIGTPYEPDTDGAILLVEDVYEAPYRVDRMLEHLRHAGKLSGVRGIVVGVMDQCDPPRDAGYTLAEVVADCLADLPVPVVTDFPVSHAAPNYTVALGIEYELDADARRLTPLESAFSAS